MRNLRWIVLLVPALCQADDPVLIFDPLPVPLRLPPGLVETLPLNNTGSFFGDAFRVVDCPDDLNGDYGTCGNQLFGGLAMTDSHLTGSIQIRFQPPVNNVSHFEVYLGVLRGEDSVLQAPAGYEFPLLGWQVGDVPPQVSRGDLDLTTGGVTNLQFACFVVNSGLLAVGNVNPKLAPPTVLFPGVRGHAWAEFQQRTDGLLDLIFRGSTFLPLGRDVGGDPVRFPLPVCGPGLNCASVLARGTSLHPHLYLSTTRPDGNDCGDNCPVIPTNTIRQFTVFTQASSFGDNFNIDNPRMGGTGAGRSHIQGRLQIQFGPRTGDTVPFAVTSLVPEGLLADPPESDILGHGPLPGLLGQEEFLRFPLVTYHLQRVVFVDEPYNFPQGEINLKTGRVIGRMVYPSFYGQSIADVLFNQNAPRIDKVPFMLIANYALFEKSPDGATVFRYSGEHKRSFATYLFPSPDFVLANAFLGGPNSSLDLFLNLRAILPAGPSPDRRSGGASNVLSSLGDSFSYNYSIPCEGAGTASFEYTNASSGTFHLTRLGAVTCFADTVTFSAFGTWSKDAIGADPRFATVQISTSPDAPYVGILVYQNPDATKNVILSSANTKPLEKPAP
jgi:hypothetical protein